MVIRSREKPSRKAVARREPSGGSDRRKHGGDPII
jgi:hypothetical protein